VRWGRQALLQVLASLIFAAFNIAQTILALLSLVVKTGLSVAGATSQCA